MEEVGGQDEREREGGNFAQHNSGRLHTQQQHSLTDITASAATAAAATGRSF